MIRHLFTVFLIAVCFCSVSISPVEAGTSRTLSLGSDPEYFTDSSNVPHWYSCLLSYPNRVDFELGDVVNGQDTALSNQGLIGHGGGVHVRLDEAGRYGTLAFYVQDNLQHDASDGAFSAYWARSFGSLKVGLGGSFSTYGISQVGSSIGDRSDSQYLHRYGLGLGYEFSPGFRLELAGDVLNSMTGSAGAAFNLPLTDDWDTFGLRLRSFLKINEKLTLVPVVDYLSDTRMDLDLSDDRPEAIDVRVFKLGIGANLQVREDLVLVFSSEYRTGRYDQRWSQYSAGSDLWDTGRCDFYQIRLRSGVESALLPWLTVRASVKYLRVHEEKFLTDDGADDRDEIHYVENVITPVVLGVGFHFGDMTADLAYNDTPPFPEVGKALADFLNEDGEGYSSVTLSWEF